MIYNEVNLLGESGDINPGRYVEVLKQGYLGVKAGDPHAIVLSAALAPTGVKDPKGTRAKGAEPAVTDLYLSGGDVQVQRWRSTQILRRARNPPLRLQQPP